jgi:GNAT superfamily N-acetyltransferase
MSLTVRPVENGDAEVCGRIGYEAHKFISSIHGYPSEQPSEDYAIGLVRMILGNPNSWGLLAEQDGLVLGSIFLHKFPPSPVAAIGPLTVRPSTEGSRVGRLLMESAVAKARKQNHYHIRLVQSPSHIRSFALYTKCGFVLREPLFLMQGQPLKGQISDGGINVHPVHEESDISKCNDLCVSVHGFSREMELRQARDQGMAIMAEQGNSITGYLAGLGLFGHAVTRSNKDLKTLIANAPSIIGPGFFVPGRNHEVINWLLETGFRIEWPANLMTLGPYKEPSVPYLPSLAY